MATEGPLPNFVIAGVMKSATSSLRNALQAHPQAWCAGELHFFCKHYQEGLGWYRGHFSPAGGAVAIGEKCPDYLYDEAAVRRMAETLPDARIVIMVRDPVDRAYSNYWHERRVGREKLSFAEAVAAEPERVRGGAKHFAYLDMGRYALQLERLWSYYPKESVQIVFFEEFEAAPGDVFGSVCRFLGVDDTVRPRTLDIKHNAYRKQRFRPLLMQMKRRQLFKRLPRPVWRRLMKFLVSESEYPPMAPEMEAQLRERFAEDDTALARSLGRSLPWRPA